MNLSLTAKTFADYREEMLKYIESHYPDLLSAFGSSDIGQLLIELQAGVADSLSYQLDRSLQETQLEYAQEKKSLFSIAKNLALKIGGKTPSVTLIDFSVIVPAKGDSFDPAYLPIIKNGTQVIGNGQVFEVREDIDFSNPFSGYGTENRKFVPIVNNGTINGYEMTKREIVFNGKTKQYKKQVTIGQPFYSLILPDKNVVSVEQISVKPTSSKTTLTINEFFTETDRFYEVPSLAESMIFSESSETTDGNIKKGVWVKKNKRFISEYTPNNYCKVVFGGGDVVSSNYETVLSDDKPNLALLDVLLNNNSLGEKIQNGSDIFIRYRVGGGLESNVGANTLNQLGFSEITIPKTNDAAKAEKVKKSLRVNNPIPALGGKDDANIEQLRQMISYNSSQPLNFLRYYSKVLMNMSGKFGSPFKTAIIEKDNKIMVIMLGLTSDGKLNSANSMAIKENVANYLSNFRNVNDYIEITDARVINLSVRAEVFIEDNFDDVSLSSEITKQIKSVFDITKNNINKNIYVGDVFKKIGAINGVINTMSVKIYNNVDLNGIEYSPSQTSMEYSDPKPTASEIKFTKEIKVLNNVLFASFDEMFEIRYPEKDIVVVVNKRLF